MSSNLYYGSYTGNGGVKTITLCPFEPDALLIGAAEVYLRTDDMPADKYANIRGGAPTGTTLNFTADGFTIDSMGTGGSPLNVNAGAYYFVAMKRSSEVAIESFVGDGSLSERIVSHALGATPAGMLLIAGAPNYDAGGWRCLEHDTVRFGGTNKYATLIGLANPRLHAITAMGSSSYTVGEADWNFNILNVTYHVVLWKASNDFGKYGFYVGNNTDDRNIAIASPTYRPRFMLATRYSFNNPNGMHYRHRAEAGGLCFLMAAGEIGDAFQNFSADGFQVGTDYGANGNDGGGTNDYIYMTLPIGAPPADYDVTAGYSSALPIKCGHSFSVDPCPQE